MHGSVDDLIEPSVMILWFAGSRGKQRAGRGLLAVRPFHFARRHLGAFVLGACLPPDCRLLGLLLLQAKENGGETKQGNQRKLLPRPCQLNMKRLP